MEAAEFGNELSGLRNTPDDLLGDRGYVLSPAESEALGRSGIDPENVRDVSRNPEHFTQSLKENAASQRFGACVDTDYTAADLEGSRLYTNKDGTITAGVKPDGDVFALAKRAGAPGGTLTVAHGMGREHIDNHHKHGASEVSLGLISAEEMAELFSKKLKVTTMISTDEIYQLVGLKEL